ncbi:nicotinate-nucleotide diphosphorylase (carboxylating), partial [Bdellovibrionota bacterium FG-1]
MKLVTDYHGHLSNGKALLEAGLQEDAWQWDWTTLGTLGSARLPKSIRGRIIAKSVGIWAGTSLVSALNLVVKDLGHAGPFATTRFTDGQSFKRGAVLSEWKGPARLVLALERPFLNLAAFASGVATSTHEMVNEVRKACPQCPPRVTATRKTLPGYRDLSVLGVLAGGGHSHRVSLAGGVLIKENHIAAAGGILKAVEGARAVAPHGLKIEIEVRSLKELAKALKAHADGVLLDNFSPDQVREALQMIDQGGGR